MIIPKEQLSADIVQQLSDMYDLEGKTVNVMSNDPNCDIISVDGEYYTIYPVEENDKEQKVEEIVSYISAKHNLKAKVEEGNDYGNNVNDYADNGDNSGIAVERGNSYFDENGDVWNWLNSESDIINAKLEGLDDYANWRIWSAVHYPNPDTEVGKEIGYFVINLSDNDSIFSGPYDDIETAKSVFDGAEYKDKSSEGLDSDAPLNEDYPTLLVAIESEKDAEITYKSLIEIEKSSDKPNQQVIDLLEKILKDELEHIALLSALSANKNSEYVAEDSQEQFDDYVDSINTSPTNVGENKNLIKKERGKCIMENNNSNSLLNELSKQCESHGYELIFAEWKGDMLNVKINGTANYASAVYVGSGKFGESGITVEAQTTGYGSLDQDEYVKFAYQVMLTSELLDVLRKFDWNSLK